MATKRPGIHGYDHTELGPDPIPGVRELAFASIKTTTGLSVAGDNVQHYLSLQDSVTAHFSSSDAGVFDNGSTTTFTGSPVYGIRILVPGTYRYDWFASPASGGAPGAVLEVYWSASGSGILSNYQAGRTKTTVDDTFDLADSGRIFWTEYYSFLAAGLPSVGAPYAKLASGAAITLDIALVVTRISRKYDSQL